LRGVAPGGPPSATWRVDGDFRSGGTLLSLADHAHDILTFLTGQHVVEAAAFSDATREDPPNERLAALVLKLSGGALAHVAASGKTPFGNRPIEILGSKGTLTIANSFAYLNGVSPTDPLPRIELIDAAGKQVWRYQPSACFRLEVEQFNRAIAGAGEPMTSAREGLRAIEIAHAVYAAMREGRVAKIHA
jgi:predicted dehydrogenase